ncbi:MFS transporter [Nocardia aurantiaca]|uniref:MFS transporter n=1 Tax=Nocardia aurantiaca TaxID=2675850 RepID=A0A6I3L3Z3_9NOCA|nr:MFS transporter [Nocardia aurantiaca]MTE15660.1 MFS transporter [Nocardia aurantiaca]
MYTATESVQSYRSSRHRNMALGALLLASFLGTADVFIIIAALPSIEKAFGAEFADTQFVATAYTLAYACTLVTGGRLGDMLGRKRVFLTGATAFAVAALGCATAGSVGVLVAIRVVQGIAAGLMLPQVLSIIRTTFPLPTQARAVSLYGAALGVATVCGQALAGLLLRADPLRLGWRTVFLVDLLPVVVIVAATMRLVPDSKAAVAARLPRLSPLLLAAGLAAVLVPLANGAARGWTREYVASVVVGSIVLTAFIFREFRVADRGSATLLPATALRDRTFGLGILTVFIYYSGTAALNMLLSYFLQSGLHRDPLTAGLQFAPLGIGFMVGSLLAGRVTNVRRVPLPVIGCSIMALTRLLMLFAVTHTGFAQLAVLEAALLITGVAQGFVVAPMIAATLGRAGVDEAGAASGTVMTISNIAVAFGVAGLGGVFLATTTRWGSVIGFSTVLLVMAALAVAAAVSSFTVTRPGTAAAQQKGSQ